MSLPHVSLLKVLLRPEVAALLLVCFLMQASHGPYYTFYTIYMEGHGYSRAFIGQLWALGVLAEVGVFLIMHRWVKYFGLRTLLLTSLGLTVLRWTLISQFPEMTAVIIFAQLLHAASFGIYHSCAIQLINRYFSGRHQGRGQALYSSLSFGAGGAAGSFLSGIGWETIGPGGVFLFAALTALGALIVAWVWIRPAHPL
jgi:PPP family 3-phenylpropionic acid transporter